MTVQTRWMISSRDISHLKEQARKLKKSQGIPHSQALDQVAHALTGGTWHQVMRHAKRFAPAETMYRQGIVIAYELKEGLDFDETAGPFKSNQDLECLCIQDVRASLRESFEDHPEGPFTEDEIAESVELESDSLLYFGVENTDIGSTINTIMPVILKQGFFQPAYVWIQGKICTQIEIVTSINPGFKGVVIGSPHDTLTIVSKSDVEINPDTLQARFIATADTGERIIFWGDISDAEDMLNINMISNTQLPVNIAVYLGDCEPDPWMKSKFHVDFCIRSNTDIDIIPLD